MDNSKNYPKEAGGLGTEVPTQGPINGARKLQCEM